ncbi:MAG: DNA polymerase Y family protein [Gammaproteobacteria bacterium]|nr:DNA polymerase Y family protein [Gammaproteobacteria bacterium]
MTKSPVVLPLPGLLPPKVLPSAVPQTASQAEAATPQPLWLALVFSRLALEVHNTQHHNNQQRELPAVAVKEYKGRLLVHTASPLAEAQGVTADMPVNAAYALCPGLQVYNADEQSQQNRLQQLAIWAEQFTSKVSIQPPYALLLEVRGSVKLFGSLAAIQNQIQQQLTRQWRHSFHSAVTPTPMASLLLAYSGQSDVVQHKHHLRSVLGRLSVNTLPFGLKKKQQLRNTGVRLLRDLWRLPKDALARRFGPQLVNYLDRTLGLISEPLDYFVSPQEFAALYEFPMEVHKTDLLLNVAGQLLQQLATFLRERDACINECRFRLYHDKHAATNIMIGVRQATREHSHLLLLLEEHLNRLSLNAPVKSIQLTARDFAPFSPQDLSLFSEPAFNQQLTVQESTIETLLEQLQARLGRDAIKTLHSVNDHRPEYAYRVNDKAAKNSTLAQQQRPFWLLPEPRLLPQKNHQPWLQGPIVFLKGPERIEAGWWSGKDIRRDYYIAIDRAGSHLWIYQELNEHQQWYLHGVFA